MTTFFKDRRNTPAGLVPIFEATLFKNLESFVDRETMKRCMYEAKSAVLDHTDEPGDIYYDPAVKTHYYLPEQLFLLDLYNKAELREFLSENPGYYDPETHGQLMDDPELLEAS